MLRTAQIAVTLIAALGFGHAAQAACGAPVGSVSFVGLNAQTLADYDPFSGDPIRQTVSISEIVRTGASGDCDNVRLKFVLPGGGPELSSTNGDSIDLLITAVGGTENLIENSAGAGPGVFIGTLGPGSTLGPFQFDIVVPAAVSDDDIVAPGAYSTPAGLRLMLTSDDRGGGNAPIPSSGADEILATTNVRTLLDINVNGANYIPGAMSARTVDLGELTAGVTRTIAVVTRANVAHSIEISSMADGVMRGPDPGAVETHEVDYTIDYNGSSPVSLTSTQTFDLGGKSGITGGNDQLIVRITDISRARVGSYRDTITLTLRSEM